MDNENFKNDMHSNTTFNVDIVPRSFGTPPTNWHPSPIKVSPLKTVDTHLLNHILQKDKDQIQVSAHFTTPFDGFQEQSLPRI